LFRNDTVAEASPRSSASSSIDANGKRRPIICPPSVSAMTVPSRLTRTTASAEMREPWLASTEVMVGTSAEATDSRNG
jgi:hypothetical protein